MAREKGYPRMELGKKQFTARDKFILITKLVLYAAARFLTLRAILLYKKLKLIKIFLYFLSYAYTQQPADPTLERGERAKNILKRFLLVFV